MHYDARLEAEEEGGEHLLSRIGNEPTASIQSKGVSDLFSGFFYTTGTMEVRKEEGSIWEVQGPQTIRACYNE